MRAIAPLPSRIVIKGKKKGEKEKNMKKRKKRGENVKVPPKHFLIWGGGRQNKRAKIMTPQNPIVSKKLRQKKSV